MFIRFDTIPPCDGRTEMPAASTAVRCQSCSTLLAGVVSIVFKKMPHFLQLVIYYEIFITPRSCSSGLVCLHFRFASYANRLLIVHLSSPMAAGSVAVKRFVHLNKIRCNKTKQNSCKRIVHEFCHFAPK